MWPRSSHDTRLTNRQGPQRSAWMLVIAIVSVTALILAGCSVDTRGFPVAASPHPMTEPTPVSAPVNGHPTGTAATSDARAVTSTAAPNGAGSRSGGSTATATSSAPSSTDSTSGTRATHGSPTDPSTGATTDPFVADFAGAAAVNAADYPDAFNPTANAAAFTTPSGNITCALGAGNGLAPVVCDIVNRSFDAPGCHHDSGVAAVMIRRDEGASAMCAGDPAGSGPVLPYGKTITVAHLRCVSRTAGVTCIDDITGAGFRVSRNAYELRNPGKHPQSSAPTSARPRPATTYRNKRYGFSVRIPAGWAASTPPANGDGSTFTADTGAAIAVYGANNTDDCSTGSRCGSIHAKLLQQDGATITYRTSKATWFVLSGYLADGTIFYERTAVGPGSWNTLWFTYPTTAKKAMDSVITDVTESFTPGDLTHAH